MISEVLASVNNIIDINSLNADTLVLGLGGLACTISLLVLLYSHQKTQKLNRKLLRLQHDLRVANGSAVGMGKQLINLEKQLGQHSGQYSGKLGKPQTVQNSTAVLAENTPDKAIQDHTQHQAHNQSEHSNAREESIYDQARSALAAGLDVAEVAKRCGLSFAEVSLLQSLHKSTTPVH